MKMAKLTYFDSDWTNETLNPSFSHWVQKVKDDKTKATYAPCKKTFSLTSMGSTALKTHEKSEKHKKNAASVNGRQIKITNVFVNTSKFESTSVSPVFKQDDTSPVSPPLNDSNLTAKHDVKNNVRSFSSSTFSFKRIYLKLRFYGLCMCHINTILTILAQKSDNCFKKCFLIVALLKSFLLEKLKQAATLPMAWHLIFTT